MTDPAGAHHRPRHRDSPRVRQRARLTGIDLARVAGTGPGGRVRIVDLERRKAPFAAGRSGDAAATRRRHRDSPRVRQLARRNGIDLREVPGSGPGGRVTIGDLQRRSLPRPASGAGVEPMTAQQRITAESRIASLQVSAQVTTVVEVDLTRVNRAAKRLTQQASPKRDEAVGSYAFVAEAAIHALARYPDLNARMDAAEETVTHPQGVHLSVALDTELGPVFAVVHDAQDLTADGLLRRFLELDERARTGTFAPSDLSGATFTIAHSGSGGMLFSTPIIIQPQSAILDLGAMVRRPVVVTATSGDDMLAIRSMAYLSLTYDHRLVDGSAAARFLQTVKDRLERVAPNIGPSERIGRRG